MEAKRARTWSSRTDDARTAHSSKASLSRSCERGRRMKVHTESAFEALIQDHLLANGYTSRLHTDYDANRALIVEDLIGFIEDTQAKAWGKLKALHGAKLNDVFL